MHLNVLSDTKLTNAVQAFYQFIGRSFFLSRMIK